MVFEDGDYYGRTVNPAARLAAVADPGQTVVDAEAVRLVGDHERLRFRRRGQGPLKGLAMAVDVFEAIPRAAEAE